MALKTMYGVQYEDIGDVNVTSKTVAKKTRGREDTLTIIRRTGLARYIDMGMETLADDAVFTVSEKEGVSRSYIAHHKHTPEECAEGRQRVREIAVQAMIDQGIW